MMASNTTARSAEELVSRLRSINLAGMADGLLQQCSAPECEDLSFLERFDMLIEAQIQRRFDNKVARCHRDAKLRYPMASTHDIQYLPDRGLDPELPASLAQCCWVDDGHNIVLMGAAGSGKTFIACALGAAACNKALSVRYTRTDDLMRELNDAKLAGVYDKTIQRYAGAKVLILDEFLLIRLNAPQTSDLLNLLENRRQGAIVLCTQFSVHEWYDRLNVTDDSKALCESVLDRLVHGRHEIMIRGEQSMRERMMR